MEYIVFCQPDITEGDIDAVAEVLRSKWIGKGPKTTELEEIFKKTFGNVESGYIENRDAEKGGIYLLVQNK